MVASAHEEIPHNYGNPLPKGQFFRFCLRIVFIDEEFCTVGIFLALDGDGFAQPIGAAIQGAVELRPVQRLFP